MQDLLAILIVLASAAYLARGAWLHFARKSGAACGSCPNCHADDVVKSRPLVTISLDAPRP